MADRYYCAQLIQGDRAILEGQEAQHLGKVMRAGPGDRITLFDNSGDQFEAEIEQVQRQKITLTILSRDPICRELSDHLTLFTALPKGDRQRWLVEKAVELGVARFVPLITARSIVKPNEKTIDRLRRTVIEASKQCGRNQLMEIAVAQTWPGIVTEAGVDAAIRLIAHPTGEECLPVEREFPVERGKTVYLAVGPEGGFTDEEVKLAADAGWHVVGLGPRILRIETAALSFVARVAY